MSPDYQSQSKKTSGKASSDVLGVAAQRRLLEAREVSIRYGARVAVDQVSVVLNPGEVIAILGPNGAGKSTLLRALNGGLRPDAGAVILDNKPLEEYSRRAISRHIAVVAQESDVRFPVTVLEFVLGGRYAWANTAGWAWETEVDVQIARETLLETELDQLARRLMSELSGGERQRAVLARALVTQAGILLLDEPTANLDLAHQAAILALVDRRRKQLGTSALVITHDVNLAAEFSDYILLMKDGRTLAFGRPDEVLTSSLLEDLFQVRILVDAHPITGSPRITPVHELRR